ISPAMKSWIICLSVLLFAAVVISDKKDILKSCVGSTVNPCPGTVVFECTSTSSCTSLNEVCCRDNCTVKCTERTPTG
ncbi:unnamed protein product, partial [Allacma fusca]